jgi:hypothetical protein
MATTKIFKELIVDLLQLRISVLYSLNFVLVFKLSDFIIELAKNCFNKKFKKIVLIRAFIQQKLKLQKKA